MAQPPSARMPIAAHNRIAWPALRRGQLDGQLDLLLARHVDRLDHVPPDAVEQQPHLHAAVVRLCSCRDPYDQTMPVIVAPAMTTTSVISPVTISRDFVSADTVTLVTAWNNQGSIHMAQTPNLMSFARRSSQMNAARPIVTTPIQKFGSDMIEITKFQINSDGEAGCEPAAEANA